MLWAKPVDISPVADRQSEEEGMGSGIGRERTEMIAHLLEFNLSIGKV